MTKYRVAIIIGSILLAGGGIFAGIHIAGLPGEPAIPEHAPLQPPAHADIQLTADIMPPLALRVDPGEIDSGTRTVTVTNTGARPLLVTSNVDLDAEECYIIERGNHREVDVALRGDRGAVIFVGCRALTSA